MIVFPQGAVLRLTEAVSEGQILILKNPRVKQEVACRVVISKTKTAAKGYVEVEFFQPTAGFWGIAFPSGSSISESNAPAFDEAAGRAQVASPPAKPVYSSAPVPVPSAPAHFSSVNPPAHRDSFPGPTVTPVPVPVPNQTLELNRAIVAAYANGRVPPRKTAPVEESKVSGVSVKEKTEHSPNLAPGMEPVPEAAPVAALASPLPAESPRVSDSSFKNVPSTSKPFRSDKSKNDAKPLGAAKDVYVSSTPIATADSIGSPDTEFSGYSRQRSSVKQGLSSSALATIPAEAKNSDLAAESKAIESDYGRKLPQLNMDEIASKPERSGRAWIIVSAAAAAVLLTAGAGTYWWIHTKVSLVSAKSVPVVSELAVAGPSPATNPEKPAASAANPHPTQTGLPQSQSGGSNQKLNSLSAGSAGSGASAPGTKSAKSVSEAGERRQTVLAARIVAPPSHVGSASKMNLEPAPDVLGKTPGAENVSLGSILSGSSSGPTAPVAPKPSGSPPAASVFQQPKLLQAVQPVYPKFALTRGDSGDVTIDALVDQYGKVAATKVLSGPVTLREAAVAAVSQQKYTPAKLNGVPTSAHVMITITFKKKD
jgi:TonB family protein